jgi:hypothetical protein
VRIKAVAATVVVGGAVVVVVEIVTKFLKIFP